MVKYSNVSWLARTLLARSLASYLLLHQPRPADMTKGIPCTLIKPFRTHACATRPLVLPAMVRASRSGKGP
jgi:hypothetical protein